MKETFRIELFLAVDGKDTTLTFNEAEFIKQFRAAVEKEATARAWEMLGDLVDSSVLEAAKKAPKILPSPHDSEAEDKMVVQKPSVVIQGKVLHGRIYPDRSLHIAAPGGATRCGDRHNGRDPMVFKGSKYGGTAWHYTHGGIEHYARTIEVCDKCRAMHRLDSTSASYRKRKKRQLKEATLSASN